MRYAPAVSSATLREAPSIGCGLTSSVTIFHYVAWGSEIHRYAPWSPLSGLIGVFIATRWTFAAELGGCQAEGGSAASMAAAALVTLANGTLLQTAAAASMAFQSMLGLICDPVANRVEVPCLGKNVMAASNALACANMALADFDPRHSARQSHRDCAARSRSDAARVALYLAW